MVGLGAGLELIQKLVSASSQNQQAGSLCSPEKFPRFLVLILSSNSQPSTSRPQRLSTELRSLSPSGNRFRKQLQALLSQREIMFQLPLHAQPQILRWTHSGEVP